MAEQFLKAGLVLGPYPKEAPQPRQKPMKVLCLGLSRTATMSTYLGMQKLGYKCYHAWELGRNTENGVYPFWRKAVEAKYYGKPFKKLKTAEDFDEALWKYDAVTDIPCALFADELLKAYPDTKVILTERAIEGWLDSILRTFYVIVSSKIWKILRVIDTDMARDYFPLLWYSIDIWTKGKPYDERGEPNVAALQRGYEEHNQHIRDIVPKDRLLVWHASQGWEPICRFLSKDIPDEPFPKVNEGNLVTELHMSLIPILRVMAIAKKWSVRAVPFAVAGLGWLVWIKNLGNVQGLVHEYMAKR